MTPTIDLAELCEDVDLSQAFVLTRFRDARDDSGASHSLVAQTLTCVGVVQPAPPETTAIYAPEGERTNSNISVWTRTPLSVGVDGNAADQIAYNGFDYRVMKVTQWTQCGLFFEAFCVQAPP